MEKREKKKASPEGREEPQKQRDQSSELLVLSSGRTRSDRRGPSPSPRPLLSPPWCRSGRGLFWEVWDKVAVPLAMGGSRRARQPAEPQLNPFPSPSAQKCPQNPHGAPGDGTHSEGNLLPHGSGSPAHRREQRVPCPPGKDWICPQRHRSLRVHPSSTKKLLQRALSHLPTPTGSGRPSYTDPSAGKLQSPLLENKRTPTAADQVRVQEVAGGRGGDNFF